MSIVVTVAEELKFLAPAINELLAQMGQIMARTSGQRGGHSVVYSQVECTIAESVARIERAANQGVLQSLDVDAPGLLVRGKIYERVGRSDGVYYTMAGPCQVLRSVYQEAGQPDSPLVDPVSLRAGVVLEGWLPQTAQAMAHQVQMNTAREAEKSARVTCRLPYSDSSFERVTHAVGMLYQSNELDVEQKLIEAYQVPTEATGVSVSLDRVSVPMEEPHPQDPEAITRVFRMAFCGTVTLHDRQGKALYTIRYGRMPQGDAIGLMEAMASDVDVMRQQRPDLLVTTLADGAADVWNLLDSYINKKEMRTDVTGSGCASREESPTKNRRCCYVDYAARWTAVRRGARTSCMAASQRSLSARARNRTMSSPVPRFHLDPGRFILISKRLLQLASTVPLPTGRPCCRAVA